MCTAEQSVADLRAAYDSVRALTERLCAPLEVEDYGLQSMPEASPPKWHLAHTTWFFEAFVLAPFCPGYEPFHPLFGHLFNSYYQALGDPWPRSRRGLLSRPTVREAYHYRAHVDGAVRRLLGAAPCAEALACVEVGLNHEQQHQELLLTDLKHAFAANPLRPAYCASLAGASGSSGRAPPLRWRAYPGGLHWLGHGGEGFAYDNEGPRHQVYVPPFRLASRLLSCGEYLRFMAEGGYSRPELWLSDGWAACRAGGWRAPLYWEEAGGRWWHYTLAGFRPVADAEPVCHVSYYEADACARWAGGRLPTEAEWEVAAGEGSVNGPFLEGGRLHPGPAAADGAGPGQLFGEAWQWTSSAYSPYPGYRPAAGALGEYNGKFMCNQFVLRGGSCASPRSHLRASYRNFFPPEARWQFSGVRLAEAV